MLNPKPIMGTKRVEVIIGWRGECEQCGKRFKAQRADAKTCSGACRKKMARAKKKEG